MTDSTPLWAIREIFSSIESGAVQIQTRNNPLSTIMGTMLAIRRIRPREGVKLKGVRLNALLTDPDAFGSSHEGEVSRSAEEWESVALQSSAGTTDFLAVAESGDEFVGTAGAFTPADEPDTRMLYGTWVAPEVRSSGVGAKLVKAVVAWSVAARARQLRLWVVIQNEPALSLYRGVGFTETTTTQELPSNPSLVEVLMTMPLQG